MFPKFFHNKNSECVSGLSVVVWMHFFIKKNMYLDSRCCEIGSVVKIVVP